MDKLHNSRMSPYEKIEALESIRCQIQGAWRTDEIRRQKPTPQAPPPPPRARPLLGGAAGAGRGPACSASSCQQAPELARPSACPGRPVGRPPCTE